MSSLCFVMVPVLLDTATSGSHLQEEFMRMYHYGHVIMPSIAVATSLLHVYISLSRARAQLPWRIFALAGIVNLGHAPFTWVFMAGTNNALFREATHLDSTQQLAHVKSLIVKWTWMHFVRCLFPLTGTLLAVKGTL